METPTDYIKSAIEHQDEIIQQAIIDLVKLFESKNKGSWKVEKVPELSGIKISYSRKLKSAPFTTYKLDKIIECESRLRHNKNIIPEIHATLEDMKKELDTKLLDQLTE